MTIEIMKFNVGIVAPAHGIDISIVKLFEKSVKDSSPNCTYTIEIVQDSKQYNPTFNKSVALNHGIRKLLDKCEVIITADVDQLVAPGMIDRSYADRDKLVHIVSRNLEDFNGEYRWEKWREIETREGCWGAWLSMSSENWKKVGGFHEYMWGWGWEDVDLIQRAQKHDIEVAIDYNFPYMHLHHEYREYKEKWDTRNILNSLTAETMVPENWLIDQPGKLPDFLIIGAQKGGTSAAVNNLEKHPNIFMATIKDRDRNKREVHFFDALWFKGTGWYKSLFQTDLIAGEKTPAYLHTHACHQRMFSTVPHAKLIVLLRDPVRRAFSAWNHGSKHNWLDGLYNKNDFDTLIDKHLNCEAVLNGRYIEALESLLQYYPREQIHIEISERIIQNMHKAYSRMHDFLGLDRIEDPGYQYFHWREYEGSYTDCTRDKLYEYYRPFNEKLFEFLGAEIPEWSPTWTDPLHSKAASGT